MCIRDSIYATAMIMAALVVMTLPTLLKPTGGWPYNNKLKRATLNAHISPMSTTMVGPGDTVTLSWTNRGVKAINGRWRGTPKVTTTCLGNSTTVEGEGRVDWIQFGWNIKDGPAINPKMWSTFKMPPKPEYGGKSVYVTVNMKYQYPYPKGDDEYRVSERNTSIGSSMLVASSSTKMLHVASVSYTHLTLPTTPYV